MNSTPLIAPPFSGLLCFWVFKPLHLFTRQREYLLQGHWQSASGSWRSATEAF